MLTSTFHPQIIPSSQTVLTSNGTTGESKKQKVAKPSGQLLSNTTSSSEQQVPISWDLGVIKDCSGSASLKLGDSFITCSVNGPSSLHRGSNVLSTSSDGTAHNFTEKCIFVCEVRSANHLKSLSSHDEFESRNADSATLDSVTSNLVKNALEPAIRLELYPKSMITLRVVVIQSSDYDVAAIINCATLALIDASVEMRDLVTAATVLVPSTVSAISLTVAMAANIDEVTQLYWSGRLIPASIKSAIATASSRCCQLRKVMESYLLEHFDT